MRRGRLENTFTGPEGEANYVIATLWPGKEGLDLFDQKIGTRIELLPGFLGFKGLTERVAPIVQV